MIRVSAHYLYSNSIKSTHKTQVSGNQIRLEVVVLNIASDGLDVFESWMWFEHVG